MGKNHNHKLTIIENSASLPQIRRADYSISFHVAIIIVIFPEDSDRQFSCLSLSSGAQDQLALLERPRNHLNDELMKAFGV